MIDKTQLLDVVKEAQVGTTIKTIFVYYMKTFLTDPVFIGMLTLLFIIFLLFISKQVMDNWETSTQNKIFMIGINVTVFIVTLIILFVVDAGETLISNRIQNG